MISQLHVENFCGVEVVDLEPGENVVTIGGKNGAGKSSVLNAIVALLGGAKALPDVPVRVGAEKAQLLGTIKRPEGDLIIERVIYPGDRKPTISVKGADGATYKRPQELLDSLMGAIGFDPFAFTRLDSKKQAEQVKELVGLDFSTLDSARADLYAERTNVGRDVKKQESLVASMKQHDCVPESEVSVAELVKELQDREEHNRHIAGVDQRIKNAEARAETHRDQCQILRDRIKNLQEELAGEESLVADAESDVKELEAERSALVPADAGFIRDQLAGAEETNAKVRANRARLEAVERLNAAKEQYNDLTQQIDEIDTEKRSQLASAPWPVEGLGFDETGGVTFNDRPFGQACSAEQLRVSLAMGMALNPKLKTLIIRDGSLIDDDTMAAIKEQVAAMGFQVFVEVVRGDSCSVVISEGRVVEVLA